METRDLETLYVKKINGTLSPDEATYLDNRFRTIPQEKKDFEEFRTLWEAAARLPLHTGLSRDERWKKLEQKLDIDVSREPQWNFNRLLRYAASITLVVTLIGIYLFLNAADPITIETRFGEIKTITLPDNSTVKMNAGTILVYDPASWDDERHVKLDGEAYFVVNKNGVPFTVASNNTVVNVLGTTFNVRSRNQTTEVACVSGKVSFGRETTAKKVILTKGTGATISGTRLSEIYTVSTDNATAWVVGDLSFSGTPLLNVFEEFERYFNVSILIKKDVGAITFTGKFGKPSLNSALETVCLSAGLKYAISQQTVTIE